MGGRKRTVQVKFRVTEEERDLILEKKKRIPTRNMAAYLRKIAIDGYILQVDHSDIKMIAEIQKIRVNVNQIAKRVNKEVFIKRTSKKSRGACRDMAVTKIKSIKGTLNKALAYIQNTEKPDEKRLVSCLWQFL